MASPEEDAKAKVEKILAEGEDSPFLTEEACLIDDDGNRIYSGTRESCERWITQQVPDGNYLLHAGNVIYILMRREGMVYPAPDRIEPPVPGLLSREHYLAIFIDVTPNADKWVREFLERLEEETGTSPDKSV